jgi:hypothetical protein
VNLTDAGSGPLWDADEAAAKLRVTPKVIRRLWRQKLLSYVEPTRNKRFSTPAQIADYVRRRTVEAQ